MRITFRVDEGELRRARKKARALGTTVNQILREFLKRIAAGDPNPQTLPARRQRRHGKTHNNSSSRPQPAKETISSLLESSDTRNSRQKA
jgi:antitoxin component of RelBE/YafQ-DinJ toxin-antitoxin module